MKSPRLRIILQLFIVCMTGTFAVKAQTDNQPPDLSEAFNPKVFEYDPTDLQINKRYRMYKGPKLERADLATWKKDGHWTWPAFVNFKFKNWSEYRLLLQLLKGSSIYPHLTKEPKSNVLSITKNDGRLEGFYAYDEFNLHKNRKSKVVKYLLSSSTPLGPDMALGFWARSKKPTTVKVSVEDDSHQIWCEQAMLKPDWTYYSVQFQNRYYASSKNCYLQLFSPEGESFCITQEMQFGTADIKIANERINSLLAKRRTDQSLALSNITDTSNLKNITPELSKIEIAPPNKVLNHFLPPQEVLFNNSGSKSKKRIVNLEAFELDRNAASGLEDINFKCTINQKLPKYADLRLFFDICAKHQDRMTVVIEEDGKVSQKEEEILPAGEWQAFSYHFQTRSDLKKELTVKARISDGAFPIKVGNFNLFWDDTEGARKPRFTDDILAKKTELNRCADLRIKVQDSNQKALPGKTIIIKQLNHEFQFGCELEQSYAEDVTSEKRKIVQKLSSIFNFVGLPINWNELTPKSSSQEWGAITSRIDYLQKNNLQVGLFNVITNKCSPNWLSDVPEIANQELRTYVKKLAKCAGAACYFEVARNLYEVSSSKNKCTHSLTNWLRSCHAPANNAEDRVAFALERLFVWFKDSSQRRVCKLSYSESAIDKLKGILAAKKEFGLQPDLVRIDMPPIRGGVSNREIYWQICEQIYGYSKPIKLLVKIPSLENESSADPVLVKQYTEAYEAMFAHPSVKAILLGSVDENTANCPLSNLFDKHGDPKLFYKELDRLIKVKWWTNSKIMTDKSGYARAKVFAGDYEVSTENRMGEAMRKRLHVSPGTAEIILQLD